MIGLVRRYPFGASYGSVQVCGQTQDTLRKSSKTCPPSARSGSGSGRRWDAGPGFIPSSLAWIPASRATSPAGSVARCFLSWFTTTTCSSTSITGTASAVDQYCSRPDYFGTPTEAARRTVRGRPQKFAHLAVDPERFAVFQSLIAEQGERPAVFASELLVALASALGMANIQTSYEYLSDGEDDVDDWDQFVHVPDLRTEELRSRKAGAAHQDEVRRLIREGMLLAERGGHRGRDVPFLHWCPGPDGAGFLLVAEPPEFSTREPVPLEQIGPPWSAGPKPTGLMIDPRVTALASSPSGRFATARYVNADPSVSVWDMANRQCVVKLPRGWHLPHDFTFLPDESAIVCSCAGFSGQLTIVPLGSGDPRSIPWPVSLNMVAVHPSGRAVVFVERARPPLGP